MAKKKKYQNKFYVVWVGREVGIFTTWSKTKSLVHSYPNSRYKAFPTLIEAREALESGPQKRRSKRFNGGQNNPVSRADLKLHTFDPTEGYNVRIFCDGACDPNPGEAASGIAVYKNQRLEALWYGLYSPNGTNNTAELNSLFHALLIAKDVAIDQVTIEVISDSNYAINCASVWSYKWEAACWTKKGGEIANLDIIKPLHKLYDSLKDRVQLSYVPAHKGIEGNELADRMAALGVDERAEDLCSYREPLDVQEILNFRTG